MPGPSYPLRLDAAASPDVSRWLWIFKVFLLIPHFLVLAFLWIAYLVLTVIAFFSILFTAKYPRSMFDFNVGVLRWTWRVCYYGYAANGTDRYPPFTLRDEPGYPTHVEVDYPDRLSRGLVLIKWWLLAIPHLIVVGLFAGGTWVAVRSIDTDLPVASGGLISILVLVAVIVLLFTGRYPQPIYDFVMGMNRWVMRVAAYVGLLTDEYPPFRMDMGGTEPGPATPAVQPGPSIPEPPAPTFPPAPGAASVMPAAPVPPIAAPPSTGWTGGRIATVISGSVLAMISFALLSGGVATLWADRTQRDDDGYLTTGGHLYVTAGAALTTSPIELSPPGSAGIVQALLGDIRVSASSPAGEDIFVGIGPSDEVEAYLSGVGVGVMESSTSDTVEESPGGAAAPPGEQTFWVTSESGVGEQTLDWSVADGEWTIVAMNPDGSRGLGAFLSAGATVPALGWITFGLMVIGVISLAAGALLIVVAVRRSGAPQGPPA